MMSPTWPVPLQVEHVPLPRQAVQSVVMSAWVTCPCPLQAEQVPLPLHASHTSALDSGHLFQGSDVVMAVSFPPLPGASFVVRGRRRLDGRLSSRCRCGVG